MDVDLPVPVVEEVRKMRDEREGEGEFMQVGLPWEMDPEGDWTPTGGSIIVLDTNILLQYLPLLRFLYQHLTSLSPTSIPHLVLIVPHIVLSELDGLKNSNRSARQGHQSHTQKISVLAREATNWLLSVLPSPGSNEPVARRFLRGQQRHESLLPFINGRREAPTNDSQILDVCLYFSQTENEGEKSRVVLLSNDRNLSLQARIEGVETVAIDDSVKSGEKLHTILDPAFVRALHLQSSSPQKSIHAPPPHRSPHSPSRIRTPPPPSMDLDVPPPTSLSPPAPPTLFPPHSPSNIHANVLILLSHLVALPLYQHLYTYLSREQKDSQHTWMEDLGDWRYWDGEDCVRMVRKYWEEGGVKEVLKRGFESDVEVVDVVKPLLMPRRTSTTAADRSTGISRWSTQPSPPIAPPAPPSPPAKSSFKPLPPTRRLSSLHSSLPSFQKSNGQSASLEVSRWSSPRWEAYLDSLDDFLLGLLAGLMSGAPGEVAKEVKGMVGGWRSELRGVGVDVEV